MLTECRYSPSPMSARATPLAHVQLRYGSSALQQSLAGAQHILQPSKAQGLPLLRVRAQRRRQLRNELRQHDRLPLSLWQP